MNFEDRLRRYEAALGRLLPDDYRRFLARHKEDEDGPSRSVSGYDHLGVRSLFEIGTGSDHVQADKTFGLVGDVLPQGMIPIADDISGNLYLLDCAGGGAVRWWDHEQDLGEDRVEDVAPSFGEFLSRLVPDEADEAG